MAANLQSVIDGVDLPDDLLPDDTKLLCLAGDQVEEFDYDDPDCDIAADIRDRKRYIGLVLAYYNDKNGTDYKAVKVTDDRSCLQRYHGDTLLIHCGFTAAPRTAIDCESSAKYFLAELQAEREGEEIVTSCRIVDGRKTTGCKSCDYGMCTPRGFDIREWEMKFIPKVITKSWENDPRLSQYSNLLADGVTLSEKARLRLPFPLLALAYYNRKNHKDYRLVDALPNCFTYESRHVLHCNFIARQNPPADDVSYKLFFAELEKRKDDWAVTACRTLHGCKTTAGCHFCARRQGKRVIHPTRGFRFGLYGPLYRRLRNRC